MPMFSSKRSSRLTSLLCAGVGVLVVLAGLRYCHTRLLIEHLAEQITTAPDEQLPDCLAQATRLGEPGLEVLVQALGSSRRSVSLAASRALFEDLARCELLPSDQAGRRISCIAAILAQESLVFDDAGKHAAAGVAARIIAWPRQDMTGYRAQLVANCEMVLRSAIRLEQVALPTSIPPRIDAIADDESGRDVVAVDTPPGAVDPVGLTAHMTALPGGALPIDLHITPPSPGTPGEGRDAGLPSDPSANTPAPPRLLGNEVSQAKPISNADRHEAGPEVKPTNPLRSSGGPVLPAMASDNSPISEEPVEARLEARLLAQRLNLPDVQAAAQAETELSRRGFSALEIDLAKRLTNPDPAVRRRWAEALPGLRGIDAKPWLIWLSYDSDTEVRLTALGLMATSNEAEMLRRVGEMAREDADPKVQEQAARATATRGRR